MTPWPAWLRLGLVLPLLGLNAFVLKRVLVQFAPFPGLFLTAALIAFLLDLPCRWLMGRGLPRIGSIAVVMLATLGLLALAAVALVPRLIEQLSQLISASPTLLVAAEQWINQSQAWAVSMAYRPSSLISAAIWCHGSVWSRPSSANVCSVCSAPQLAPRSIC